MVGVPPVAVDAETGRGGPSVAETGSARSGAAIEYTRRRRYRMVAGTRTERSKRRDTKAAAMAGRILYFRVGSGDEITLEDLRFALQKIAGVLSDLDAAAARNPRGAVRWRVSVLQKKSPPLLGVTAEPVARRDPRTREMVRQDTSRQVEAALLDGVRVLDGGERPSGISDAAIDKIRHLAVRSRRIGDIHVYSEAGRSEISETTLSGINKVLGSATRSKGSILGTLDTIAVHYGNEIRVWDENSHRAVRCRYPDSIEDDVKDNLRKRVLVGGMVAFNARGQAVSVQVETLTPYGSDDTLPTIEEVSGILRKSSKETFTLTEYMEHLRDGG